MEKAQRRREPCAVCGKTFKYEDLTPLAVIRSSIASIIRQGHPKLEPSALICRDDLNEHRAGYIQTLLASESGELSQMNRDVLSALANHDLVTQNLQSQFTENLSHGERLADLIASFGGSWKFIILFWVVILSWISLNSLALTADAFDPYPYILLNLVLSCLAALQAPIIMMSQNRQDAKDRLRSDQDYKVNLKSEVEIRNLHEKVDHLIKNQWQALVEIQQIQLDMMRELKGKQEGE